MANGTPQPPGTFLVGGMAFNITISGEDGSAITDFSQPITIVLQIDLAGRAPGDLAVSFFNTTSGEWETIQAMIAADGTVTIVIDHLTLFAIFEVGSVRQPFAAGFSAITFIGPSGTDAGAFAASLGADVGALWRWDAAAQDWEGFFPDAPAALSTLATLRPRDVLFVRSSASGTYTSADLLPEDANRTATLVPGFTFVSFNGADGTAIADLLAGNPAFAVAFLFDAAAQGWLGFYPAQPFLNGFTTLDRLAGVFVLNDSNSSVDITLPEIGVG